MIDKYQERLPSTMSLDNSAVVTKIFVETNDFVKKEQDIALFESNNHELTLSANNSGKIKLFISEGQTLHTNDILWEIISDG